MSGDLSDYEGGMSAFGGGGDGLFSPENMRVAGICLVIAYLLWFLWKNWPTFKALSLHWNPLASSEGMSAGLTASYAMATNPGGTAKYMVTGDSLNNSAGWLPSDYADVSKLGRREQMWNGREGMSNIDIHSREGYQGSNETPAFWEPNQYLTEAREYGIPDLSSNFKDGSANRTYWGAAEGLTQGQLHNIMNS